LIKAKALAHQK